MRPEDREAWRRLVSRVPLLPPPISQMPKPKPALIATNNEGKGRKKDRPAKRAIEKIPARHRPRKFLIRQQRPRPQRPAAVAGFEALQLSIEEELQSPLHERVGVPERYAF